MPLAQMYLATGMHERYDFRSFAVNSRREIEEELDQPQGEVLVKFHEGHPLDQNVPGLLVLIFMSATAMEAFQNAFDEDDMKAPLTAQIIQEFGELLDSVAASMMYRLCKLLPDELPGDFEVAVWIYLGITTGYASTTLQQHRDANPDDAGR